MHSALREYLDALKRHLAHGYAGEETHRAALAILLETLVPTIEAVNEPKRTSAGAPDFVVLNRPEERRPLDPAKPTPLKQIGYVETKDIGKNLDKVAAGEQLERYRGAFENLILTDYLTFILYRNGEEYARVILAEREGKKLRPRDTEATHALLQNFLEYQGEGVGTAIELARRMAAYAGLIHDGTELTLMQDQDSVLAAWKKTFEETLLPNLTNAEFADMLAQTLTYGLFAARTEHDRGTFSYLTAFREIPETNPFLRNFFRRVADEIDERLNWILEALADVLDRADMHEILKDFGQRTRREDPVVHFYEDFLQAYDPQLRELRGVYYTPEPVVQFIVRAVDTLLERRFDLKDGLANKDVNILDPATGTGTFLYYAIQKIYERKRGEGEAAWRRYAQDNLLSRIFGFELLMAPFTVAHLKLGLELKRLGAPQSERLGVFLTNTLDDVPPKEAAALAGFIRNEAAEALKVKAEKPVLVVLGNPPYSVSTANKKSWIRTRVDEYKRIDDKRLDEKNWMPLQDDYVKFIRWGEWRISEIAPQHGILAFITNHSYLDNPTFRGMRHHLLKTFDEIYVLNLHGNSKRREKAPDGSPDRNVFDIQQGVAITILVRNKDADESSLAQVNYADLWGTRESKYTALLERSLDEVTWQAVKPQKPFYFFVPQNTSALADYKTGWKVTDIMPVFSTGIKTHRDDFVIGFEKEELESRFKTFCDKSLSDDEVRTMFFGTKSRGNYLPGDNHDWSMSQARRALSSGKNWRDFISPIQYRPFDKRWILYSSNVIDRDRREVMRHLLYGKNYALNTNRQTRITFNHALITNKMVDFHTLETAHASLYTFPLYLYPDPNQPIQEHPEPRPNLAPKFVQALEGATSLKYNGAAGLLEPRYTGNFVPKDVLAYIYAILYSPTYRTRYAEFLRYDFPRIPLPPDADTFLDLADLGHKLIALHTLEPSALPTSSVRYEGEGNDVVEKPVYKGSDMYGKGQVFINKTQRFEGVPLEAWEFTVGGYQVLDKYLKDRKGRVLSYDEIQHYRHLVSIALKTQELMQDINERIPEWPMRQAAD